MKNSNFLYCVIFTVVSLLFINYIMSNNVIEGHEGFCIGRFCRGRFCRGRFCGGGFCRERFCGGGFDRGRVNYNTNDYYITGSGGRP